MRIILLLIILPLVSFWSAAQQKRLPIIDIHVHANKADMMGPEPMTICIHNEEWPAGSTGAAWGDSLMAAARKCKHPLVAERTDDGLMNKTLEIMKRYNVYGVTSGRLAEKWKTSFPDRIILSHIYRGNGKDPSVDSMRKLFISGQYKVLGEIETFYNGISADDSSLASYWAMAEELNIPVGIHIGPAPIGSPYLGWQKTRARLHSPLQLEEVLIRHPRLRVYIMHAAWPMIDELIALLWVHPQVYVDISGIITDLNNAAFYSYLKKIIEAGFIKRIMFGSDSMMWPQLMEVSIKTIQNAPFLSNLQKRDILYNNAARFLNLSEQEIKRHHQ